MILYGKVLSVAIFSSKAVKISVSNGLSVAANVSSLNLYHPDIVLKREIGFIFFKSAGFVRHVHND